MLLSLSWRNVWRNKLRSSVILTAVGLGMFAGVFAWAFYAGMVNERIETAISTESSNIQIHAKGYLTDPNLNNTITDCNVMVTEINEIEGVKGASKRLLTNAMALSAEQGTGVLVMGVYPEAEVLVTNINENIIDGEYFKGIKRNPVVVGKKLAEKLKLKKRSKLVLTFQNLNGDITKAQFRVAGIFDISNSMYEEMNVFVRYKDLAAITGIAENTAHEIAIKLDENNTGINILSLITEKYPDYEVKLWRELLPEVSLIEETMDVTMIMFIIIILVGLCLAIVNTMLMAVLERVKEIGMLMAIGMNRKKVFGMVVTETVFLTLTGTVVGIIVASLVSIYFGHAGIDLSKGAEEAYGNMGFSTIIYPHLNWKIIIEITIMVSVASVFSAIYPAIKALKLNPANALRSDV